MSAGNFPELPLETTGMEPVDLLDTMQLGDTLAALVIDLESPVTPGDITLPPSPCGSIGILTPIGEMSPLLPASSAGGSVYGTADEGDGFSIVGESMEVPDFQIAAIRATAFWERESGRGVAACKYDDNSSDRSDEVFGASAPGVLFTIYEDEECRDYVPEVEVAVLPHQELREAATASPKSPATRPQEEEEEEEAEEVKVAPADIDWAREASYGRLHRLSLEDQLSRTTLTKEHVHDVLRARMIPELDDDDFGAHVMPGFPSCPSIAGHVDRAIKQVFADRVTMQHRLWSCDRNAGRLRSVNRGPGDPVPDWETPIPETNPDFTFKQAGFTAAAAAAAVASGPVAADDESEISENTQDVFRIRGVRRARRHREHGFEMNQQLRIGIRSWEHRWDEMEAERMEYVHQLNLDDEMEREASKAEKELKD